MLLKTEFGLVAAALFTAVAAAPSEPLAERDVIVRNVDPCTVDKKVVELHEKYGTGLLPQKVEDCIVTQLGPTFMNAFYNSYDSSDNSVNINGHKVNIDGSIIGNGNHDNIVGDNVIGDDNTVVKGDHNTVSEVNGDGDGDVQVGEGIGNGIGNIDGNVNNTNSVNDGNSEDITIDANNNTLSDVFNDNSDNSNNTAETIIPDLTTIIKRDVVSCFSFKYLTAVNNLLPCIFTAISSSDPQALLQCGVSKLDICASAGCMPEGIQEYVGDLCAQSSSPFHKGPVTTDLADSDFHMSTDNNIRAFLGLLTQSELTAIRNYESSHAKKTGVESSCVLGSRCGEDNDCCLGTCGTINGKAKCFGII